MHSGRVPTMHPISGFAGALRSSILAIKLGSLTVRPYVKRLIKFYHLVFLTRH